MTRYRDRDGMELEAANATEVVSILRDASWYPAESDQIFMESMAKRAFEQTGKPVRFSSPDEFLEDILKIGLIEEVKVRDELSKEP